MAGGCWLLLASGCCHATACSWLVLAATSNRKETEECVAMRTMPRDTGKLLYMRCEFRLKYRETWKTNLPLRDQDGPQTNASWDAP